MAALSLWVRRTWSRRWLGLVGLGLMIAVVGGVTLAVTAGARRTASAFHRLEVATNAASVQVDLIQPDDPSSLSDDHLLPPQALADQIAGVRGVDGVTVATFIGATPDPSGSYFAAALGATRGKAPQDRLLAGRLPDPAAASEVVINEPAVQAWHTDIGRTLSIHTYADDQIAAWFGQSNEAPRGPVMDATVVGVSRGIEDVSDVPEPIFFAGPAFVERWSSQIADATTVALVNAAPGHDRAVVEALNTRLDPRYRASRTVEQDDFASRVAETIDVEVTVLTLFAIAAALAGLVVVSQALARTVGAQEAEEESLAALGLTRPEGTVGLVGVLAPALLLGTVGAVALALALSPTFPRGLAHRVEPAPGLTLDPPVVIGGGLALLLILGALAGMTSWRAVRVQSLRDRHRAAPTRPQLAARLAAALPPVASLGTMFALDPGPRRRAMGGMAGIVGAAVLVGGAVGVATVENSRHTLLSTSELYGADWDYQMDLSGVDPATVLPGLAQDRDVASVGVRSQLVAGGGDMDVGGPKGSATAGVVAYTSVKGSIPPVMLHGHQPGPGEAAVGRDLGRRLGVAIGDSVVVKGYAGDVPLVVRGWFVNPGQDDLGLGVYVARDTLDSLTKQGCSPSDEEFACKVEQQGAAVVLRRDAPRAEVERRLHAIAPDLEPVGPPSVVENLEEVGATPWLLAGFLGLIGGAGLAHALIVGVRHRQRDLAVVRAIGLRPGQARRVVSWQAFVMASLGAVAGVVIGLLAGRMVWERVATGIGAIVRVEVPVVALLLAPTLAIALGLALSLLTGRRAAGLRPALVLRAE